MIDLHTHTTFSDGELIVAELARRAQVAGLSAIAITDHGDPANLDLIVPRVAAAARLLSEAMDPPFTILPGIELTHLPLSLIAPLAARARELGAKIVVVHGETVVEPVPPGTNRAAILAGVDVLAHPGLITEEDVALAAKNNVLLEITGRKGHSLTNGHVARLAKKLGAAMVVNSDSHAPGDLMTLERARLVVLGAGLSEGDFFAMQKNADRLVARVLAEA
ncbi:MAG: histidinol phosphate phosphatase domain-containing protein [Proteobacteria bacterium]|nr:histidinol phosphate phosphatase domain-containing protein [Pseudomonadota bacterium]